MTAKVPERWSAEGWEAPMRSAVASGVNLYPYTVGVIESIVSDLHLPDVDKVLRIREVLIARGRIDSPTETIPEAMDRLGLAYEREADDPTPVSGARVPPHFGGLVDDRGLVDDGELLDAAPTNSFTVHFSFGHGQTDPDTGENLLDKYVTVTAPTYDACREAMFNSRYGERWSFEYEPGSPEAERWIPQWTEHERIDATRPPAESR